MYLVTNYSFTYYSISSFTHDLSKGFDNLRKGIHKTSVFLSTPLQTPKLIMKVMRTAIQALAFIPNSDDRLRLPKHILKITRDFTNFIDGIKSVDGVLNFNSNWKVVVLNLSGLVLFSISCITMAEMFKLANFTALKVSLAAIPVLGVLPFGGMLNLATLGLFGMSLLLSLDKRKKIIEDEKLAKLGNCQYKIDKIESEKGINSRTLVNNIISIARQVLIVGASLKGSKSEALSLVKLGLSVISTTFSLINYSAKKALKNINQPQLIEL